MRKAMPAKIEKFYTKKEAAEILRRSPKTISNMISARQLTAIKGRPVLIPASAITEFLGKRKARALA